MSAAASPPLPVQGGDGRAWAVRGLATGAGATAVALVSHVLAGGATPGPLGIGIPLLLATSASSLLAGIRPAWPRLVLSVAVSQALFHTLFVLGAAAPKGAGLATGHAGHGGHGDPALTTVIDSAAPHAHTSSAMLVAHLTAGLVTIAALRRGEVALATLRRLLAGVAEAARRAVPEVATASPPLPHVAATPLEDEGAWVPPARTLVRASLVRRGPPALVAA